VGPNYLQLPINAPKTHVATNQRDGQMTYHVDGVEAGENPHVNYEPSARQGLVTAQPHGRAHTPFVSGHVVRQTLARESNFSQAGERWRAFESWERDELVSNLVGALSQCGADIQQRMLWYFAQADTDYGRRVAEGLGVQVPTSPPPARPPRGWAPTRTASTSRRGTPSAERDAGAVPSAAAGTQPTPPTPHPHMLRTAQAVWNGTGKDGTGHLTTPSGALQQQPYSFQHPLRERGRPRRHQPRGAHRRAHAAASRWPSPSSCRPPASRRRAAPTPT
jgi:hypothetical protein